MRLELHLEYAGQPGFIFFDLVYSPEQAAYRASEIGGGERIATSNPIYGSGGMSTF